MTVEESKAEQPTETEETKLEPGPTAVDVTPLQDGGVLKEVLKEGSGSSPSSGCKVKVHYEGRLLDGTIFDSSKEREPFEFNLGKGNVIKAWDIGVATMKEGEVAKFFCREDYAYRSNGSPPKIPPGATLVFEVSMLGWEAEDLSSKKDKGILRYPIEAGEGTTVPNEGAEVEVSVVGEFDGRIFDNRECVKFSLGEGAEEGIPPGIEKALEKFTLGEKSKLILKPHYAFGSAGSGKYGLPGGATVTYTVKLQKFEKMKDSWMLESKEKIEHGKLFKEKGTNYFKGEKFQIALKMYKKMMEYLEFSTGFEEELEQERKTLLLAAHLNIAMCYLKLQNFTSAKNQCDKAIEQDPKNVKALFRRGQAYLSLNEPEKAKEDFEKVITLDPTNKAALSQKALCNKKIKEIRGREKEIYTNMFEKYSQKKEWRYGWWEKDHALVKSLQEDPNLEEEKRLEREAKKRFLEEQAKLIKEMKEERERRAAEEAGRREEEAGETPAEVSAPPTSDSETRSTSSSAEPSNPDPTPLNIHNNLTII